jgi:hypothetical protein
MMHTDISPNASRRAFLKRAGLLTGASALPLSSARAARYSKKLKLFAEGRVPPAFALSPVAIEWPTELQNGLATGQLEFRQRVTFPWNDQDVLEIQVIVVPPNSPLPLPEAPATTNPPTISLFYAEIMDVIVHDSPTPHLAMLGEVIGNPVKSPFGDMTGYAMGVATGFKPGAPVEFTMLGGFAAAHHTTWSPTAIGTLEIAKNLF